ncbi:hypothetical protein A5727_04620 [Mycobacterium sp. ACS4331]|nr:hypothetical protein A5727_04620 [Mycobacterium sp. ACS4331]
MPAAPTPTSADRWTAHASPDPWQREHSARGPPTPAGARAVQAVLIPAGLSAVQAVLIPAGARAVGGGPDPDPDPWQRDDSAHGADRDP